MTVKSADCLCAHRRMFVSRLRCGATRATSRFSRLGRRNCSSGASSSSTAAAAESAASSTAEAAVPPTNLQLFQQARLAAIPMLGFGFMDNIIMIQAGGFIDSTFGVVLGLSTLTAAAMGNVVSDTSGTLFGGIVESAVDRMRLTQPRLTDAQRSLRVTKLCGTGGAAVGVIVGCILGASSLLFMDLEKADRLKKLQELQTVSHAVLTKAHALLEAERCSLYFFDQEKAELWTRTTTNNILISLPLDANSLACHTARSRTLVNVRDATRSAWLTPS